jgi:hypothetical protein
MQAELQGKTSGSEGTRFKPGQNSRTVKQARIAAKAEELRREYFPNGGMSVMAANRLRLAAQHYVTAETCRDPVVSQRATRCAEYLLSKIKPPPKPPIKSLEEYDL